MTSNATETSTSHKKVIHFLNADFSRGRYLLYSAFAVGFKAHGYPFLDFYFVLK